MSCRSSRLQVHRSLLLETRGFAAAGPRRARTAHTFRLPHLPPPATSHPDHQDALAASMNAYYLLYAGALVFMMQAGFAMLCAGSLRMKNIKVRVLRQRARRKRRAFRPPIRVGLLGLVDAIPQAAGTGAHGI